MFGPPLLPLTHRMEAIPAGLPLRAAIAAMLCLPLLACGEQKPTVAAVPLVAITTDELVGKWGLASYRSEDDRARTEVAARSACSNPYVITKGATGGVMMHLADQTAPQEVFLKQASNGAVYIGPQGQPGDRGDRQVVSNDKGVIIVRWIDPDVAKRYGTMVFVHCGAATS